MASLEERNTPSQQMYHWFQGKARKHLTLLKSWRTWIVWILLSRKMCLRSSPQPRPQGFSLTKWVGREKPHPFFKGKALGTRVVNREKVDCYTQMWAQMNDLCQTTFSTFAIQRSITSGKKKSTGSTGIFTFQIPFLAAHTRLGQIRRLIPPGVYRSVIMRQLL